MSDKTPPQEQAPNDIAHEWLYRLESLTRVRNFTQAGTLFHQNCIYYGLDNDHRAADWAESWTSQRKLSFDMNQVKLIPAGDLILAAAPWVAQSLIEGAQLKQGRLTVGLMSFSNGKVLAVIYHNSRKPEAK